MAKPVDDGVLDAWMHWLCTPPDQRIVANLPRSKRAFADKYGVSDRTLRRYENGSGDKEEAFQRRVAAERKRRAAAGSPGRVPAVGDLVPAEGAEPRDPRTRERLTDREPLYRPGVDDVVLSDRDEYQRLKRVLVAKAAEGNQAALDSYMRHWGKDLAAAELEGPGSLSHMSMVELAQGVLSRLSDEEFAEVVAVRRAAVA